MSGAVSLGLLSLAFSALVILDLYRGTTSLSHIHLSRADHPRAYWAVIGFMALAALTTFSGAFQLWSLGCEGLSTSSC